MRERKYRVWDNTDKKMLFFEGIFNKVPFTEKSGFPQYESMPEYHELKIMDWTGLKDDNETDIYEGDILKDEFAEIEIVIHERGCFDFGTKGCLPHAINPVIIGNIFENKELIPMGKYDG